MAEENYISIFSKFISKLLKEERITLKDAVIIMKSFEPVCESIHSRADLIKFIDKHVGYYWELKSLISDLKNPNHQF